MPKNLLQQFIPSPYLLSPSSSSLRQIQMKESVSMSQIQTGAENGAAAAGMQQQAAGNKKKGIKRQANLVTWKWGEKGEATVKLNNAPGKFGNIKLQIPQVKITCMRSSLL